MRRRRGGACAGSCTARQGGGAWQLGEDDRGGLRVGYNPAQVTHGFAVICSESNESRVKPASLASWSGMTVKPIAPLERRRQADMYRRALRTMPGGTDSNF